MMRLGYAVTLEYPEAAPDTVRGEMVVANPRLGARRALEAALRAYPGRRWTSVSVLLVRVEGEA